MTAALREPRSEHQERWALVEAAQQGNTAAYGQLYNQYRPTVFKFCLFRLGEWNLAEDLTSETFLRALRRIGSVTYQGRDVGAWFITIARNLILDHVKSKRYRMEYVCSEILDATDRNAAPHVGAFGADPEDLFAKQVVAGELHRCLALLHDDWRDVLTYRFLQGKTVAETAQLMDRHEGAVKALQLRACRGLAKQLPEGIR